MWRIHSEAEVAFSMLSAIHQALLCGGPSEAEVGLSTSCRCHLSLSMNDVYGVVVIRS